MPLTSMHAKNLARLAQLTALSLVVLSSATTQAQTAAPAPAPAAAPAAPSSPAKQALVKRVLDLQRAGIEALGNNLTMAFLQQMRQQVPQLLQARVAADKREAVARDIEADVRRYFEEVAPYVRDRAVKLAPTTVGKQLDEQFTEAELKQLVGILESPVNRKYQSMSQDFSRALNAQLLTDVRATVEPKLRVLDQSVATRLGLTNPPAAAPAAPGPAPSTTPGN